ncbi:hypothetical protein [Bdellovibrio sp. BCCA]|uniref:hypothetical protein n=1 Tax=Bdellovibrio sp. BCCA TaxID=3136281 RepID=UPI0030EFF4AC
MLCSCSQENSDSASDQGGYNAVGMSILGTKAFPTTKYDTPFATQILVVNDSSSSGVLSYSTSSALVDVVVTVREGSCAFPLIPAETRCLFDAVVKGTDIGVHSVSFSYGDRTFTIPFTSTAPADLVFDSNPIVNFGTIKAGEYRSTVIRIRNAGGIPTVFSLAGVPSYALLNSVSCDGELDPLEACDITVNFSPTVNLGLLQSNIVISTSEQSLIADVSLTVIPADPSGTIGQKNNLTEVTLSGGPKEVETLFVTDVYGNIVPEGTTGVIQFSGLDVELQDGTPIASGSTIAITSTNNFIFRIKAPAGTASESSGEVRIISGSAEFFRSYTVRP